jgi:hypothetical protein
METFSYFADSNIKHQVSVLNLSISSFSAIKNRNLDFHFMGFTTHRRGLNFLSIDRSPLRAIFGKQAVYYTYLEKNLYSINSNRPRWR